MEDITREFKNTENKNIKVLYNDNLGNFEVYTDCEVISFYDKLNEAGDASDGSAKTEVQNFIDNL